MPIKVFVDSDVVISSLISENGAAYFLTKLSGVERFISNVSREEFLGVMERLKIDKSEFEKVKNSFEMVEIDERGVGKNFKNLVWDLDDAHIIFAASESKAKFLLSYNLKHFKVEEIKKKLGIVVLTPGKFVHFLRSVDKSVAVRDFTNEEIGEWMEEDKI